MELNSPLDASTKHPLHVVTGGNDNQVVGLRIDSNLDGYQFWISDSGRIPQLESAAQVE